MESVKGLANGLAESFNPMELNKYHTRMIDELSVLNVMVNRLENTVKIIDKTVNPLYDTYNICSVVEAKYVLKLVMKRLNEYSKKGNNPNLNRVTWPKYILEDIGRDINLLQITLESLNMELHVFDILQKQDGRLSASMKRNVQQICETNITPLKDVKLDMKTALKMVNKVTNTSKKVAKIIVNPVKTIKVIGKKVVPKDNIKKQLRKNSKQVVHVRKTRNNNRNNMNNNKTKRLYPDILPPVTSLT